MKFINKDLIELQEMLEQYKKIKLKYIRNEHAYNESEKNTFKNNFYIKKLDILLSIIYQLFNKKALTIQTNPFMEINNKEDERQYIKLICKNLSELDLQVIAMDIDLISKYEKIKDIITNLREKYIYNINFWELFISFYIRYNNYIELNKS